MRKNLDLRWNKLKSKPWQKPTMWWTCGVEAEGEAKIVDVGDILEKDVCRNQFDEGADKKSEWELPGNQLDLTALREQSMWDNPMVCNEDPETFTNLDRFVSATSKVVGNAPLNS